MRIEPTDPRWICPEMKEMFDTLAKLRDIVWEQCRTELGDDFPDAAPAAQTASRRFVRDPQRRAEIIESYRQIAARYESKMVELVGKYTVPHAIVRRD